MIIVVMGVAGSGKTLIGRQLAKDLGWHFVDADDLHPAANIARMAAGVPLTDDDREPWLDMLRSTLRTADEQAENVVLACSALRERFRKRLATGFPSLRYVYLRGTAAVFDVRLRERTGHFFNTGLLQSQFDTLEEPADAVLIDASQPPEAIVTEIKERLAIG